MKPALLLSLCLLPLGAFAGSNTIPGTRIPEPEMWALIGVTAVAIGLARFIRRK